MSHIRSLGDGARDAIHSVVRAWDNQTSVPLDENYAHQGAAFLAATTTFERVCDAAGMSDLMKKKAVETGQARMEIANPFTESPLEKIMLPWLIFQDYGPFMTYPAAVHLPKEEDALPEKGIVIVPQFAFVRFRVDFAVVARHNGHSKIVAVECDGAEYHNVARDQYRDRYLASWGITTVRADGKAIYREPQAVSERVAHTVCNWLFELTGGSR